MRKVIVAIGMITFSISNAAETIISTGTLSIDEMKKVIQLLKEENDLQNMRIENLEKRLIEMKERTIQEKELREKEKEKEEKYCVKGNLNVRKCPSKSCEIIAWLKKGSVVETTGEKKGIWVKILQPSGWISSKYLKECSND